MNREILEKPFGPEQIKQREGNFGKMLDYIEGHAVIQRLNDAFDGDWSFTMTKYEIMKETDEVIVIGQLNAGGIVKSQFGSSRITRAKETGDIISLADDLKAAATDALKKAATLLGVGLHLYRNERPQWGTS
jgi:recombination DNA repair RAD52 pathway protein